MSRTVCLGVSGGIAAYKSCEIVSRLRKLGYTVKVIMTKNAMEFVTPLTFETLSNNEVITDMFAEKSHYDVEHISLAKEAKMFIIAPATANVIAKVANGIADDMLTTTFLASKAIKVICPAMNVGMYENEATAKNLELLKERGCFVIEPKEGFLACGDVGKGRMSEPSEIVEIADKLLMPKSDLRGKKVLVTAGATRETIDGVRFISNYSSGKMGVALAEAALDRGAEVTLVAANISVNPSKDIRRIDVESTVEMLEKVLEEVPSHDIIIKAAAPADYRVKNPASQKIKAEKLTLELEKNPDIAKAVGEIKGEKTLVVFAAETEELMKNAKEKLLKKNADFVVANDVTIEGAGFNTDTNIITLIAKTGEIKKLPIMTKREVADIILDEITK